MNELMCVRNGGTEDVELMLLACEEKSKLPLPEPERIRLTGSLEKLLLLRVSMVTIRLRSLEAFMRQLKVLLSLDRGGIRGQFRLALIILRLPPSESSFPVFPSTNGRSVICGDQSQLRSLAKKENSPHEARALELRTR